MPKVGKKKANAYAKKTGKKVKRKKKSSGGYA